MLSRVIFTGSKYPKSISFIFGHKITGRIAGLNAEDLDIPERRRIIFVRRSVFSSLRDFDE